MTDNAQALGYAVQTGFDTENLPAAPLAGVLDFANPAKVTSSADHFKTNHPFNQLAVNVQLREGQVDWNLAVTPANIAPVCASGLGPPASGVYKAGVGADTYITVRFNEGLAQYWKAKNHRVNTTRWTFNLTDGLRAAVQSLGPAPAPVLTAWTTLAPALSGQVPFHNWQCYLLLDAALYRVRRFDVGLDNKLTPLVQSQGVVPDETTLAGLTPDRYKRGDGEISVEMEALYTGNAGSEFEKWQQQMLSGPWSLICFDPATGATALVQIDIPVLGWTVGEIMREDVPWMHMTGLGLFSQTDTTPLLVTVVS